VVPWVWAFVVFVALGCWWTPSQPEPIPAGKYLHKYIHKGGDKASVRISPEYADNDTEVLDGHEGTRQRPPRPVKDEIGEYVEGRYISTAEAIWRFFAFPLHHNFPSVYRLPIHLPGQHNVLFSETADLSEIAARSQATALTKWFEYNQANLDGHHLTYVQFPEEFTYAEQSPKNQTAARWQARKRATLETVGRVYPVSPRQGEKYYLRVLLHHVKGATSWEDLRTVDGTQASI
jgi:hypothetical protein